MIPVDNNKDDQIVPLTLVDETDGTTGETVRWFGDAIEWSEEGLFVRAGVLPRRLCGRAGVVSL